MTATVLEAPHDISDETGIVRIAAIGRLRSKGFFGVVADRAKPTVESMLD